MQKTAKSRKNGNMSKDRSRRELPGLVLMLLRSPNQLRLIEAIAQLRQRGIHIHLDLSRSGATRMEIETVGVQNGDCKME